MIDEEATFKKFGYYSTDLKPKSGKKIIAVCDIGGEVRELTKQNYRPICRKCTHKTLEYHKNASKAQKRRFEDQNERDKVSIKMIELWENIDYREMMCVAQTGKKLSDDHKEKLKGRIPWNKGKIDVYTEKSLKMMSDSRTGLIKTAESIEKIRETTKLNNINYPERLKYRISKINKYHQNQRWNVQVDNLINGIPITDWIKRPSNDYGISQEEYDVWRHAVYERDNHTCQICWANHCEVSAHHIIPQRTNQDLILDVNNGITMCRTCHELTYGKEKLFIEELQMIIKGEI